MRGYFGKDRGSIGIIGFCWGYMGILEENMETAIIGFIGFRENSLSEI